jgi:hypothetical protein
LTSRLRRTVCSLMRAMGEVENKTETSLNFCHVTRHSNPQNSRLHILPAVVYVYETSCTSNRWTHTEDNRRKYGLVHLNLRVGKEKDDGGN